MSKAIRTVRIVLRILLLIIVGLLFVYNLYMFVARVVFKNGMPRVFGFACAAVVSGSMADEIEKGDFIITKKFDEYAVGDIITFEDGSDTYITHRIVMVSGDMYATKGDANPTADNFSVPEDAIVGKVVAVWKGFGNIASFLQSPLGLLSVAGGGVVVWLTVDIFVAVFGKTKKDD